MVETKVGIKEEIMVDMVAGIVVVETAEGALVIEVAGEEAVGGTKLIPTPVKIVIKRRDCESFRSK